MAHTVDPKSGTTPIGQPGPLRGPEEKIVAALESYRSEADINRKGGFNPRDQKWEENLALYWNRHDFTKKASWQSQEVMPEVSSYVDRFAAALKEALIANPTGFYTVEDPADKDHDLTQAVKRMTDVWLSRVGRNQMGQLLAFPSFFEEQMKLGAITACSCVVTWKEDVEGGRVAIETVDPRFVWLDHTYRNLYRIRRVEMDKHDMRSLVNMKDGNGRPLYNLPELDRLLSNLYDEQQAAKEQMSGHGQQVTSGRSPIVLDEYIATVVDEHGQLLADKALMVVANGKYLVRGPEANPFWHKSDWLVYAPLVTAPLSVYGRSYMEDFGAVASTYMELTNMILDAVHVSALNAIAVVPGALLNPEQLAEGVTPGKMFLLEEGMNAKDFAQMLELGKLSPDAVRVWEMMKNSLSEAAGINEIGMGQFAPKGRTSATEVTMTQQSSSALIRSVAQTVEQRVLDPILDLTWKTGLQHVRTGDVMLREAAGPEMFSALMGRRRELIQRPFTFQARGISSLIRKSAMLKSLLGLVQVVSTSEILLQEFLRVVDIGKLTAKLFELSDIDLTTLQLTDRERMIREIAAPLQQAQQAAGGPGGGEGAPGKAMGDMASAAGIGA